jgi:hypothetical protein
MGIDCFFEFFSDHPTKEQGKLANPPKRSEEDGPNLLLGSFRRIKMRKKLKQKRES